MTFLFGLFAKSLLGYVFLSWETLIVVLIGDSRVTIFELMLILLFLEKTLYLNLNILTIHSLLKQNIRFKRIQIGLGRIYPEF